MTFINVVKVTYASHVFFSLFLFGPFPFLGGVALALEDKQAKESTLFKGPYNITIIKTKKHDPVKKINYSLQLSSFT